MPVCGPICSGCPNEQNGEIFIPFDGMGTNKVLIVGDSGWQWEAKTFRYQQGTKTGTPFAGPSGHLLNRIFRLLGEDRKNFLIGNSYWCKAPHLGWTDHPEKFPEAALAMEHCRPYLDDLIARMQPKVLVPLGNVALRRVAGVTGIEKNHSYILPTQYGIPAIPTFHPSYILQGKQKMIGPAAFAFRKALEVAKGNGNLRQYDLLLDPLLDEVSNYFGEGPLPLVVCDIETPETDDLDEEEAVDSSYTIVRISFSIREGTAISFPWQPPYDSLAREVLARTQEVVFWNAGFDVPRLKANGCDIKGRIIDAMYAWHWLQSDLPKALGFVAPLFVNLSPWKHLAQQEPARYSALDSAVTMDCYLGIRKQLEADGRWGGFDRHCIQMMPILDRMGRKGLTIDLVKQAELKVKLENERDEANAQLQVAIPDEVKPTKVYKRFPPKVLEMGEKFIPSEDGKGGVKVMAFNAGSSQQVLKLIRHLGLPVPRSKDADRDTTESKHLKKLSKKNELFRLILDYRERAKLIDAYMWQPDADGRVRSSFGFHPSTWRKSSRNPNVQTIPKRNDLAKSFRRTLVASKGSLLFEIDSSAIEAVLTGYYAGSEDVIRLAKAGIHGWMSSAYQGENIPLDLPFSELAACCKAAKKKWPTDYERMKRVNYLSFYLGTPQRMVEEYPLDFSTVKVAREMQNFFFSTKPGKDVRAWQQQTLTQAHKERFLEIPWKYRHYFYSVFVWDGKRNDWVMGDDAKRAVAFRPQASASAFQSDCLLEAERDLELAEALAWPVHDAIIGEAPKAVVYDVVGRLYEIMTAPISLLDGLTIGAEAKVGESLAEMEEVALDTTRVQTLECE